MKNLVKQISKITYTDENLIFRPEEEVKACLLNGELVLQLEQGKLIGFVICKQLAGGYLELGSLYVMEEARGKGVAKKLIEKVLRSAQGKKILLRTKNSYLKQYFKEKGFVPVKLKTNPLLAGIYLYDRFSNLQKFNNFIKTVNKKSCVLVKK